MECRWTKVGKPTGNKTTISYKEMRKHKKTLLDFGKDGGKENAEGDEDK